MKMFCLTGPMVHFLLMLPLFVRVMCWVLVSDNVHCIHKFRYTLFLSSKFEMIYSSVITYVSGAQKNRLIEMVFLVPITYVLVEK